MDTAQEHTQPNTNTEATEQEDARRAHQADRPPTARESTDADRHLVDSDEEHRRSVAEHYEEMADLGAEAKGEGRID